VAELSERLQITQQNVFKIVNLLARAGLIEAMRGRNGGVRLGRAPGAIRIGDVVRSTEVTHVEIDDDVADRKQGRGRRVNQILDEALSAFIDVLDQHTLADMAKGLPGAGPHPRRKSRADAKAATASTLPGRLARH
jgi:Rrf2 family protein